MYPNAQTLEWALMGPVYAMNPKPVIDLNGNVYTIGDYYGLCDFDPVPNIFNLTDSSGDIVSLQTKVHHLSSFSNV